MATLKARIPQKTDTQANWEKAINFIPLKGEVILYQPDSLHPKFRMKIGDGETAVNNLPFVLDEKYVLSYVDSMVDNAKHEVLDLTSNAFTGTVSGEIIRLDDVSPIQQWAKVFLNAEDESIDLIDVGIKRYGKNLFNPALLSQIGNFQSNNVIYIENSNSFVHAINGTVDLDYDFSEMNEFKSLVFKPNTQYSLSFQAYAAALAIRQECVILGFKYDDDTEDTVAILTNGYVEEFQDFKLSSRENKTVVDLIARNGAFSQLNMYIKNIQLEVGNKVTEYYPYINYATHKRDTLDEYYTNKVYTNNAVLSDPNGYGTRNDIVFATIPFEEAGQYRLRFSKLGGAFAYFAEAFLKSLTDTTVIIRIPVGDYREAYEAASGNNKLPIDGAAQNPNNTLIRQGDWVEYDIDIPQAGTYEVGLKIGSAVNSTQTFRVAIDEACLGANMLYPYTTLFTDTKNVSLICYYSQDSNSTLNNSITVDNYIDYVDLESENPVQNKILANELSDTKSSIQSLSDYIDNYCISEVQLEEDKLLFHTRNIPVSYAINIATPSYIDNAIGDIETALDNIITKYGLGSDIE